MHLFFNNLWSALASGDWQHLDKDDVLQIIKIQCIEDSFIEPIWQMGLTKASECPSGFAICSANPRVWLQNKPTVKAAEGRKANSHQY